MKLAFHPWLEAAPAAGNPARACICSCTRQRSQQAGGQSRAPQGQRQGRSGDAGTRRRVLGPGAADGLGLEFRDQALAEGWEESLKENPLPPRCTAEGFPSPSPKQGAGWWGIASSSELRVQKAQSAPARL